MDKVDTATKPFKFKSQSEVYWCDKYNYKLCVGTVVGSHRRAPECEATYLILESDNTYETKAESGLYESKTNAVLELLASLALKNKEQAEIACKLQAELIVANVEVKKL